MQAKDIFKRVRLILADPDNVRWTLPELALWLTDAQSAIATAKPNTVTRTVTLALVAGHRQTHDAIALVRVLRNVGGPAITTVRRETMDAIQPGWHDPVQNPASGAVHHVMLDMMDPRTFYVTPPNDGTGAIEATLAELPPEIAELGAASTWSDYTQTLALPDIYREPLTDYVLYRAFSRDGEDPTNAARATAHYAQFQGALGLKASAEKTARPSTTGDTE